MIHDFSFYNSRNISGRLRHLALQVARGSLSLFSPLVCIKTILSVLQIRIEYDAILHHEFYSHKFFFIFFIKYIITKSIISKSYFVAYKISTGISKGSTKALSTLSLASVIKISTRRLYFLPSEQSFPLIDKISVISSAFLNNNYIAINNSTFFSK